MTTEITERIIDRLRHNHSSDACHMCKSQDLMLVLDLGHHPHSDDFLSQERLRELETKYPLRLVSCRECGLLQIDYFVDPEILYATNYLYQSSTTARGVSHYRGLAASVAKKFSFPEGSFAIDIGSNVGVLLEGFKSVGFEVLGVDPAETVVGEAVKKGIPTIVGFFDTELPEKILKEYRKANVITATNVFAHLHNLDVAVRALQKLLASGGVVVVEAPSALDLINNLEYDTIYHQHITYLSAKPMRTFFDRFGLELFAVEHVSIHGGSLRYFVGHKGKHPVDSSVDATIAEEEKAGLYTTRRLEAFAQEVNKQRQTLQQLLVELKSAGKRIVCVSAPAKGNTLLNYCGITTSLVDYATERNPLKVGLFTPGTHLPILTDAKLLEEQPDYALLLAWNFADEIISNNAEYQKRGGKFIIPIPMPKVV